MSDFTLGNLSPKQQSISRFKQVGEVILPLINRSQARARFRLEATDHDGVCHFEFQVPDEAASLAQQAELWLSAGETVDIPVRLLPPPAPFISLSKPVYFFTVTATMLADPYPSRSVLGQIRVTPLIGPWPVSLATICLVVFFIYVAQILGTTASESWPVETHRLTPAVQVDDGHLLSKDIGVSAATGEAERSTNRAEMTYEEIFQEIAVQYDFDWRLLAEIAYQESRMDPLAIGQDSDMGLMQIIPSTWSHWAPKVGVTDPFDPYSNVLVGAAYLADVRDYARRRGYYEEYWMLVGYNWGPAHLRQIFDNNEGWAQIPEKRRRYALDILQARAMEQARWQLVSSAAKVDQED